MRVIAGSAGGLALKVVSKARPYLEKARGAIFNSLAPLVPGARVLDLYAGSGASGIEALSRGAERAVFVEADRASVAVIRENLAHCRLEGHAEVKLMTAQDFFRAAAEKFTIIFIDPPFGDDDAAKAAYGQLLARAAALLDEDGRVVFRLESRHTEPPSAPGLTVARDKRYGRSQIIVYRPAPDAGAPSQG